MIFHSSNIVLNILDTQLKRWHIHFCLLTFSCFELSHISLIIPRHKKVAGYYVKHSEPFECPSVRPSALRLRTPTLVSDIYKIHAVSNARCFLSIFNRVMALDRRQNSVYAQYLVN